MPMENWTLRLFRQCRNRVAVQLQGKEDTKFKGQLQRFHKLVSYERAVQILKNDMCITEIGQAVLEIFEFKVKFPRKISKIRNFSMIRVEQCN